MPLSQGSSWGAWPAPVPPGSGALSAHRARFKPAVFICVAGAFHFVDLTGDIMSVCFLQRSATTRSRFTSWISEWPVPWQGASGRAGVTRRSGSPCQTEVANGPDRRPRRAEGGGGTVSRLLIWTWGGDAGSEGGSSEAVRVKLDFLFFF